MIAIRGTQTLAEWESALGEGLRRIRIEAGYDQIELAGRANISRSAVQNLERGSGSRLRTVLAVLRALDRADALDALLPSDEPTPLEVLEATRRSARPQHPRRPRS